MNNPDPTGDDRTRIRLGGAAAWLACLASFLVLGCGPKRPDRIAVIPQTEGNMIWEAAHVGAEEAAHRYGAFIYWNAPTREDDVEAQIALVDRIVAQGYQGLVLAPDQALALMTPVRRAISRSIPTVVIGSPLAMPPGGNLFYILNDDEAGGRLAAQRVGEMLRGTGTVALLGIDPDLTGIMTRTRVFEQVLAQDYPGIRIVEKRMGSFNFPHEQQAAQDTINSHPDLDAIIALMATTVDGTLSALDSVPNGHRIGVIGFDVASPPLFDRNPGLNCIIQEDTRAMGEQAVALIVAKLGGRSVATQTKIEPRMITRENVDSPAVHHMWSQDWTLGHSPWSPIQ